MSCRTDHPGLQMGILNSMNGRRNQPQQGQTSKNDIGQDPLVRMVLPVGRSGWAIAAGYLGLFSFGMIPAPIAVIVSIIAIRDISKSKETANPKHGMGRAIFGLLAGLFGCFLLSGVIAAQFL